MNKLLLIVISILFSLSGHAQIVRKGELFTKVDEVGGKVVFIKEIPIKSNKTLNDNYQRLKEWAKENYARDPFISSIRHDSKNHEFVAKSKIELLLPQNSKGIREKMIMRYRVNGFIIDGKCVLEITDISYLHESSKQSEVKLPRIIKAEVFITDKAIAIKDEFSEIRENTRKSTIFFINQLTQNFELLYK